MTGELDRVLGQAGLQLREGEVYLSRMGAEKLSARPGDRLEIFLGPIALPYRVVGIVDEAGPLAALFPVVMMRLDEAQQLLFMQGRINNVLVSNAGDAAGGLQHTAAMSRRLRVLALDDPLVDQIANYLRTPEVRPVLDAAITKRIGPSGQPTPAAAGTTAPPPEWAQALFGSLIPVDRLPRASPICGPVWTSPAATRPARRWPTPRCETGCANCLCPSPSERRYKGGSTP